MIISLAILSLLLMMISLVIRQLIVKSDVLNGRVQMLESIMGIEDLMRSEFQRLQFVPYCPEMLPSYNEMLVGYSLSVSYREYLQSSVMILSPKVEGQSAILDLLALRGGGSGGYSPVPRKRLQSIVQGSDILQVSGLQPTNLFVREALFVGDLTADLVGVRSFTFFVTDCRQSMVVKAQRRGSHFEMDAGDYLELRKNLDMEVLQVYIVKEYLIYLQLQNKRSYLTIDFLDGQVFYRMPDIVDMRLKQLDSGLLSVRLLLARPSQYVNSRQVYQNNDYVRVLENAQPPIFREILIGLEQ
ncbi:hypothetical protein MMG00_08725 [Ignatzschineria rhizosphaerae]|uniref:Uncharacterized protein n=1 Tax=Ignatzschineria rhizosphaerae TaxID=2923279 RepID=A0ABY3X5N6_9GAMM|nr:hypothetical protein [Ignatzschineria rhizosphaerae]UNM95313.1 hypothetical protein MMG00_08725 [Ignatzschineria rhizosphaerae]